MEYEAIAADLEVLGPYITSCEVGFYSNISVEGPVGSPITIETVAALYPAEPGRPDYRMFGSETSLSAGLGPIRARLLELHVRHEIIEKFRKVEESWQNLLVRSAMIAHVSGECRAKRLPICAVILGKSSQDNCTDAAVLYCRAGMPPQIALDMLQQALRHHMAEEQGRKIDHGQVGELS